LPHAPDQSPVSLFPLFSPFSLISPVKSINETGISLLLSIL
jgi:hypothetical protein